MIFTTCKVGSFFTGKSVLPAALRSNVVYKFICSSCGAAYVGETKRHLRTRIAEHGQKSRNTHVFQHNVNCNGRNSTKPNTKEFQILANNFNGTHHRKTYEALSIIYEKPTINVQLDFTDFIRVFQT